MPHTEQKQKKKDDIELLIWSLAGYPGLTEHSISPVAGTEESKGEPTVTPLNIIAMNQREKLLITTTEKIKGFFFNNTSHSEKVRSDSRSRQEEESKQKIRE